MQGFITSLVDVPYEPVGSGARPQRAIFDLALYHREHDGG